MSTDAMRVCACYIADDKIRKSSSSGGIFSAFAEKILEKDGIVYGVAMSEDCKRAEYIRAITKDELKKLRGSKYVQAYVGDTFRQVKCDLDEGRLVLFSGTGCLVNGLKCYLNKDYERLICIDFICHGVPSPSLWRKYIENYEEKHQSKVKNVNFRSKEIGWNTFGLKIINDKNEQSFQSLKEDSYLRLFLRNYCLRPSCYECHAKNTKNSDITIADFWGVEHLEPELYDDKGTSLAFVRTAKGEELFESILNSCVAKEISYQTAVEHNKSEYSSVKRPKQRDTFFKDMEHLEYDALAKKYLHVKLHVRVKRKVKNLCKKILSLGKKV